MLYLGVCETHEAQADIIRALTRKFRLAPDVSIEDIASRCPFNYTGADFYALCSDALLNAMSRRAQEVDDEIGMRLSLPLVMLTRGPSFAECSARMQSPFSHATILSLGSRISL
jgi:SpoVK/Ycf46/Vps4 family AAA+-type ATPase